MVRHSSPLEIRWFGFVEMTGPAGYVLLAPRNGIMDGWIDEISAPKRKIEFRPYSNPDLHSAPLAVTRNEY